MGFFDDTKQRKNIMLRSTTRNMLGEDGTQKPSVTVLM